jgi:hypothetical protein
VGAEGLVQTGQAGGATGEHYRVQIRQVDVGGVDDTVDEVGGPGEDRRGDRDELLMVEGCGRIRGGQRDQRARGVLQGVCGLAGGLPQGVAVTQVGQGGGLADAIPPVGVGGGQDAAGVVGDDVVDGVAARGRVCPAGPYPPADLVVPLEWRGAVL